MPAPLGKTPTKKMPKIDVLGTDDSPSTRAAVRFFRERRIVVRYVDLRKRPIDAAELRGFMDRLGAGGLLEQAAPGASGAAGAGGLLEQASPGADGGPGAGAAPDRGSVLAMVRADPALLRLPLVRHGEYLTAGPAEATWTEWLARGKRG